MRKCTESRQMCGKIDRWKGCPQKGIDGMINIWEVNATKQRVEKENLDVSTITIGVRRLECIDSE